MVNEPSHVTRVLATADGRQLEVLSTGPEDGLVLLFHNGTPGGLVAFPDMAVAAAGRGLRTVMYARPGYGDSIARPGRRIVDAAADVAAVLDGLGAREFVTVGWSGGGPHALACAALLPGRCLAAASLAGVAPLQAGGLDWMAGMGPENVAEFTAAGLGEAALTAFLEEAAAGLGQVTGRQVAEEMGGLISAADQAVVTAEFAEYLAESFRIALRAGIAGWRDDDIAFVSDWGFRLEQAGAVPVAIWQGDEDRMVPFSHGAWLAGHIPGARAHLARGEGHLTLAARSFGTVLDDLLDLAGHPPAIRSAAPGP
jgi:pimeloyl-ACP methyl ester carboxylesterase